MFARSFALYCIAILTAITVPATAQDYYYGVTDAIRKNNQTIITSGARFPEGIAIDENGGKIYWADANPNAPRIRRANLDGSNAQTLVSTDIGLPKGVALDLARGHIYWTDAGVRKIFRANLDGGSRTLIAYFESNTTAFPAGIAVDPVSSTIYWVDINAGTISKKDFSLCGYVDHRNVCGTVIVSGLSNPLLGLGLDAANGKLYWTEAGSDRIRRANVDGSNVETIVNSNLKQPYGLAVDAQNGKVYWADVDLAGPNDKIQRADLDGSNVETLISSGLDFPSGVALVIPPPPEHDLELSASNSTPEARLSESVTLSFTLNNRGPDNASSVRTKITLPATFTYQSNSGTGTYDNATGTWIVSTLNNGSQATLRITGTLNAPSVVSAEIVGSTGADPDSVPNNGSTTEDDDVQLVVSPAAFGSGSALSFNGSNEYATFSPIQINQGVDVTIEFWVNPTRLNDGQAFVAKNTNSGDNILIIGFYDGGYHVRHFDHAFTSNVTKKVGLQHIALTINYHPGTALDLRLYRNGILIAESSTSSFQHVFGPGRSWSLGQEWDGDNRSDFLAGQIDEVRVWNTVRSQTDIRSLMHRTLTGTESNLNTYLRLDVGSGSDLYNYVTARVAGTRENSRWQVPSGMPLGQTSAFQDTGGAMSHGPNGAQMTTTISGLSTPGDQNLGLYTYGSPTEVPVTGETFLAFGSTSDVIRRSHLVWGIEGHGSPFFHLTLPYGNLNGFTGVNPRVLYRADAGSPWFDYTNSFTLDRDNKEFRATNIATSNVIFGRQYGHLAIGEGPVIDLELSASRSADQQALGQAVTMTFTLANRGPDQASTIKTKLRWPSEGLQFQSHSGDGSYNSSTHEWSLSNLANSATASLTLTVIPTASTTVSAEIVSATGTELDATFNNGSTNEDDDAQLFIVPQPRGAGAAIALNGIDQYVDIPGFDNFTSSPSFSQTFTLELWVNPTATDDQQCFIGKHTESGDNLVLLGFYEGGYHVRLRNFTHTVNPSVYPKQTGWQHLVLRVGSQATSTSFILFRNGELIGIGSTQSPLGDLAGKDWTLGQDWDGQSRTDFLQGEIDEVRFWSTGRGHDDYRNGMHRTVVGNESNLFGYWRFDEGQGTMGFDYTGNGHHATIQSSTWMARSTAPIGQSAHFIQSASPASVGETGAQMTATLTRTPDDANTLGLYTQGSHTGTPIDNEAFPGGITRRSDLVWGIHKRGNATARLVFTFANHTGLDFANPRLLKREDVSQPWQDVTDQYTYNANAKTFTRQNVSSFSEFTIGEGPSNLPVELVAFEALRDAEMILLRWQTASETNNAGFYVEQQFVASDASPRDVQTDWHNLAFIEGSGTSSQAHTYQYRLSDLESGTYRFRLKQTDFDGRTSYSEQVEVHLEVPRILDLEPAYPNPLTVSTTLAFTVPTDGYTSLRIYDVLGRNVATVFEEYAHAGRRYGERFDASMLAPGTYLYRLTFGSQHRTGRMIILQ